jgi:hypothetical protein
MTPKPRFAENEPTSWLILNYCALGVLLILSQFRHDSVLLSSQAGYVLGQPQLTEGRGMKVSVKRSGGYAGLTEEVAAIETAQLDAAAAQQVEQIIQSVGFFDLPATISDGTIGADLFSYEITVSEGDRQHTVTFTDDESPETAPLRRLVETLTEMR